MKNIFLLGNNGFLGNEYQNTVKSIRNKYNDYFELIDHINNLIYDMYNNLNVKNDDTIGIYLVSTFFKVHKSFQSCSILYNYGLEEDVHIILRTMLESLFVSASIKKDNNNFKKLIKNQDIEDKQKTNSLIDMDIIKNEKKSKIDYRDKTNIWQFAKQTEYKDMYHTAYSFLSSYIHVDLRTLSKNYEIKNKKIDSICVSPSTNNLCFILTEIIGLMLAYIDLIKDYLKKDYTNDINKLKLSHMQLQKINEQNEKNL